MFFIPFIAASFFGMMIGYIRTLKNTLHRKTQIFRAVADFAQECTFVRKRSGEMIYISPACEKLTGYTQEDFYQDPDLFNRLIDEDDREQWDKHQNEYTDDGVALGHDYALTTKKGQKKMVRHICAPYTDEQGQELGLRATNFDVTEEHNRERNLSHLARFDSLTRLGNRLFLNEQLKIEIKTSQLNQQKLAVLFMDLDRFKYIYDVYGHNLGDHVLREISQRFIEQKEEFGQVFRFGGDEFVILMRIDSDDRIQTCIRQIQTVITQAIHWKQLSFVMDVSIGVALYPEHGHSQDELIKHADLAMYEAKHNHKDYAIFDARMAAVVSDVFEYENLLRKALVDEQLLAYFQPIINLSTGEIEGAEALMRWQQPEQGMIPPAQFIDMAEDTGLIIPVGQSVFRQSFMAQKRFKKHHASFRMSVNLSARQLQQESFCDDFHRLIESFQLEPSSILLELTESILVDNIELASLKLKRMQEMGFRVALDDFGTGYSSIQYLADLPIDVIKLDRSLIENAEQDEKRQVLLAGMISIAKRLNMDIICEGIENEKQSDLVKSLGVDRAQGYLYGKPMNQDDFEQFLESWSGLNQGIIRYTASFFIDWFNESGN